MAKIFWIAKKEGNDTEMFAFNNKRKAQQKAMELAPNFSFGDNEVEHEIEWGTQILYSGTINAKNCFILYRENDMPYAKGDFANASEAYGWMEKKGRKVVAGACFPVKLKGGMCSVDIWDQVGVLQGEELFKFDKYVENDPDFDWYADEVGPDGKPLQIWATPDGKKPKSESFKYVPTFESFIGSQKLNENTYLSDSGDGVMDGSPEAEAKWAPVLKAFGVRSMDDLVWLGEYFPEIVREEGKKVKGFTLDNYGDEDPHGEVDFNVFKWNGMLIGEHDDEMQYSATLCKEKDVSKWMKILKDDEDIDLY